MFCVFLHPMVYYGIILNTSKILCNYEKVSTPYIFCLFLCYKLFLYKNDIVIDKSDKCHYFVKPNLFFCVFIKDKDFGK